MIVMMVASRMLTVCSLPASTTKSITSMTATTTVKIASAPTLFRSSRVVVKSMGRYLSDFDGRYFDPSVADVGRLEVALDCMGSVPWLSLRFG